MFAGRFRPLKIKPSARGAGKQQEGGGEDDSGGVYYVLEWGPRAGLEGRGAAAAERDLEWLATQPAQQRSALRWMVDEGAPELVADLRVRREPREGHIAQRVRSEPRGLSFFSAFAAGSRAGESGSGRGET